MNHLRIRLHRCLLGGRSYTRPPILGVLGHVDHGKTTLIDSLRKTNNVSLEAGGITQKNSIFQHTIPETNYKFTIVDTPGHAAFSRMRATGSSLTDAAILVVDAKEGVLQQTRECIRLLRANNIPLVVALNKMDLPNADPDLACEMLFDEGIETVPVGGNIPAVPISALSGEGLPSLMDAVKQVTNTLDLTADDRPHAMEGIMFDVQTSPSGILLMTVLVRRGQIRKGDRVICNPERDALVRDILSVDGKPIQVGLPGMPVVINGLQSFAGSGSIGNYIYSVKSARTREQRGELQKKINAIKNRLKGLETEEVFSEALPYGVKKVSFIVCADTTATLETIEQMLNISTNEVSVAVHRKSVKTLKEEDIRAAEGIDAPIILFNVPDLKFPTTATVLKHNIIYDLATDISNVINEKLPVNYVKKVVGKGKVAEIHGDKKRKIIGVNGITGTMDVAQEYLVKRGKFPVWQGRIASLKFKREDILVTSPGTTECGMGFAKKSIGDVKVGDVVECVKTVVKPRKLIDDSFFGASTGDVAGEGAWRKKWKSESV